MNIYETLRRLIYEKRRNEVSCGHYLQYIPEFMVKKENMIGPPIKDSTQVQGFRGKSDFVVSATISEGGSLIKKIFVWELKAPQSNIFNIDKGNKLKPSKFLIDAENKLLNYVDEFRKSEPLREHFSELGEVIASRNVFPGGLIMSRDDNKLLKGKITINNRDEDYLVAKGIRGEFFWTRCDIRLYTWNDILNEINKKMISGENLIGDSAIQQTRLIRKPKTKIYR